MHDILFILLACSVDVTDNNVSVVETCFSNKPQIYGNPKERKCTYAARERKLGFFLYIYLAGYEKPKKKGKNRI